MSDLYPTRQQKRLTSTASAEPWVDIHRAAEHLGVKTSWLYANGDAAGVPVARLGRARRYRLSDLDSYLLGSAA